MSRLLGCCLFICTVMSCAIFKERKLPPKREFRGVWIATVANIDWPNSGNDLWEKQQRDFTDILDFYKGHNFNAVIVQIRTAGDAFYPSTYSPWSRYLTGEEGIAPQTQTDPLKWMIDEAHLRGMDFHAWMNPYRATFDKDTLQLDPEHDFFKSPQWMVAYGNRYYYNPGVPEVRSHLENVVQEVVDNYEIDGIHFDDYFYPYRISGQVFNDSTTFAMYGEGFTNLEDWRRANVDSLIRGVHDKIKSSKPWVQFGVSPFGVWRNRDSDARGSATKAGQTNYDHLFADPLTWLDKGWLDYIVPQIYWSLDFPPASFRTLAKWWAEQVDQTPLYIGHGSYKIKNNADEAWQKKKQLIQQVQLSRLYPEVRGNVFYNASSLYRKNPKIAKLISRKLYKEEALLPTNIKSGTLLPWQQDFSINSLNTNTYRLEVPPSLARTPAQVLIYGSRNKKNLDVNNMRQLQVKKKIDKSAVIFNTRDLGKNTFFAISFLDLYGIESLPTIISLKELQQYGKTR